MVLTPKRESRITRAWRAAVETLFWLLLLFSIASYGGNNPLSITLSAAVGAVLLPFAFLLNGGTAARRLVFQAAVVVPVVVVGWAVLQTVPLPSVLPSNPVWSSMAGVMGPQAQILSVTPGDMRLGAVKLVLPFVIFLISLLLFDTDRRAERAILILAVGGGLMATASIVQYLVAPEFLIAETKRYYLDSLTAPFVNRNTAGTFYGTLTVMLLARLWNTAHAGELQRVMARFSAHQPISRDPSAWLILGLLALAMTTLLALFLTRSRAATVLTLCSLVLMIMLLQRASPIRRRGTSRKTSAMGGWMRSLVFLIVLLAGAFAILTLFGEQVILRAQVRGATDARFCITPGLMAMIRDHGLAGAGLTSFRELFPLYRDPHCGIAGVFDKAHNLYAEGLITLGLVFPLAVVMTIAPLLSAFYVGYKTRRRLRYASVAGLSIVSLAAAHSAVDFSLQIPGFTTFLGALLAPLVSICLNKPLQKTRRSEPGVP